MLSKILHFDQNLFSANREESGKLCTEKGEKWGVLIKVFILELQIQAYEGTVFLSPIFRLSFHIEPRWKNRVFEIQMSTVFLVSNTRACLYGKEKIDLSAKNKWWSCFTPSTRPVKKRVTISSFLVPICYYSWSTYFFLQLRSFIPPCPSARFVFCRLLYLPTVYLLEIVDIYSLRVIVGLWKLEKLIADFQNEMICRPRGRGESRPKNLSW